MKTIHWNHIKFCATIQTEVAKPHPLHPLISIAVFMCRWCHKLPDDVNDGSACCLWTNPILKLNFHHTDLCAVLGLAPGLKERRAFTRTFRTGGPKQLQQTTPSLIESEHFIVLEESKSLNALQLTVRDKATLKLWACKEILQRLQTSITRARRWRSWQQMWQSALLTHPFKPFKP